MLERTEEVRHRKDHKVRGLFLRLDSRFLLRLAVATYSSASRICCCVVVMTVIVKWSLDEGSMDSGA